MMIMLMENKTILFVSPSHVTSFGRPVRSAQSVSSKWRVVGNNILILKITVKVKVSH